MANHLVHQNDDFPIPSINDKQLNLVRIPQIKVARLAEICKDACSRPGLQYSYHAIRPVSRRFWHNGMLSIMFYLGIQEVRIGDPFQSTMRMILELTISEAAAPRAGVKVVEIIVFNSVPFCASTVCL